MSFPQPPLPQGRSLEAAANPVFAARWSRRAFSAQGVRAEQLAACFEAARWAASCYNDQPWQFRYATREGARHGDAASVLVEGNRSWAQAAPVIGVVFTRRTLTKTGAENAWSRFDAGAASAQFALQASLLGLSVHFMAGFDPTRAYAVFGLDATEWDAVAAFALGHPGEASELPEALAQRELPSTRKPLAEVAQELK
jgi:nitroreductase